MTHPQQQLIAKLRKQAQHERNWDAPKGFGARAIAKGIAGLLDNCADELEAALSAGAVQGGQDAQDQTRRTSGVVDVAPDQNSPNDGAVRASRRRADQGSDNAALYTADDLDAGLGAIYNETTLSNAQANALVQRVRALIEASHDERVSAGAVPQPHGWQPIATAPKDGTQVWVWDDERGSNPALFLSDAEVWVITYDDAVIQPTHWQPIPAPPSQGEAAGAVPQQEPQEHILRAAWEEGFRLCRGYGDNHAYFDGEQKERQWRDCLSRLRAIPSLPEPQERPYAALKGSLRGDETDAEFEEQIASLRESAASADIRNARELLEANGYQVARPDPQQEHP